MDHNLKLKYNGETRQVKLNKSSAHPFGDLVDVIVARFGLPLTVRRSDVYLTYIDSDGDEITLSTDEELSELLSSSSSSSSATADSSTFKFTVHTTTALESTTRKDAADGTGLSGKLQHEIRSSTPLPAATSEESTQSESEQEQPQQGFDDPPETPAMGANDPRPMPHLNEFLNSLPQRTASVREAVRESMNNRSTANADFSALHDLPDVLRSVMDDVRQALGQVQGDLARELAKVKTEFSKIQVELQEQRERSRNAYRRGSHPAPPPPPPPHHAGPPPPPPHHNPHHHNHHHHHHPRPFGDPRLFTPHTRDRDHPFYWFQRAEQRDAPSTTDKQPMDASAELNPECRMPGSFDHATTNASSPNLADLYAKLESYGLSSQDDRVKQIALRVYVENRGAELAFLVTSVLDKLHGDAKI